MTGRHVAELVTPAGEVPASGAEVSVLGMDIFQLDDDEQRIVSLWAVADWLTLLMQTGALAPAGR
jgi:hypothetical protein